MAHKMGDIDF